MKLCYAFILSLVLLGTSCQQPLPKRGSAPETSVVWRVDASTFGDEERLAAVCLQGLANRGCGRVFIDYGNALRWMQMDFTKDRGDQGGRVWSEKDAERLAARYADVHDYWIEFYEQQGLCRFVTVTLPELMEKLGDELKGVILYSNVTDDLALAATMAGVRDAVPLSQALYDDWMRGKAYEKPVVFDVRSLYAGYPAGADRRLEAHRWMIEHVYPECDKSGAVSRDRTYGQAAHDTLVDIDLAVSRRWVTFDLSFMSEESRNREKKNADQPHPEWGFDPPDKPLLQAMGMRGLTQWSGRQEVEYAPDGTPVIHSNYYYPRFRPEAFADLLIKQAPEVPQSWFIVVYGGNPHWFYEVARRAPAGRGENLGSAQGSEEDYGGLSCSSGAPPPESHAHDLPATERRNYSEHRMTSVGINRTNGYG